MTQPTYDVLTYDIETGEYTEQDGLEVPSIGVDLWGLKRALQALKTWGYSCHRNQSDSDPSVLVRRVHAPDSA